jgi:plasmid stabilization system protein ParE
LKRLRTASVRSVVWSPAAQRDVAAVYSHLAQFNPAAAQRVAFDLYEATDILVQYPYVGRGVTGGRCELVAGPYVIVFGFAPQKSASCASGTVRRIGQGDRTRAAGLSRMSDDKLAAHLRYRFKRMLPTIVVNPTENRLESRPFIGLKLPA